MVVDTSVVLAIFFGERHAAWAADQLDRRRGDLLMSTVNLSEALIRIQDRQPRDFARLERELLSGGFRFVPPDVEQARIAAAARLRFPLNLGDCFAYALARQQGHAILTIDPDFRCVDCKVEMP